MSIEELIINNLLSQEEYTRKVLPFIKPEYFTLRSHTVIFEMTSVYVEKYNVLPTREVLYIELDNRDDLNEQFYKDSRTCLENITLDKSEYQWIMDSTERWCQERAVYLALMESIKIADGQDTKRDKGAIPSILSEALGVSFDQHVGHDYVSDAQERYDFYHRKEDKIPFDLSLFNKITKGGLPNKTLNIALAGTGVGKSLFMCHCAAATLLQGKNVLYITLEMAEERIAERIDANLLNVSLDDLMNMPKDMYEKRMGKLKEKVKGKLIIKEYPTASANPAHFRALLNDLALKKNFKPDIIFVDYLNICASARIKAGANVNSYTYIKAIAEELRGLAVENNVPIVSATQTTRSGFSNSDPGLEDTSESFGLPATADFMFALVSNEELQQLNQMLVKQLKNRYNDPNLHKRFTIGVDRAKMKLYDLEQKAQDAVLKEAESKPVFDRGRSTDKFKNLKV